MPVKSVTLLPSGFKDVQFEATPAMSTYLVAFLVSDFVYVAAQTTDPMVRVYARSDVVTQGTYAADISARIVKAFGELYKFKYPLPKLDLAAVPDFAAGAMENWGLLTFRETALLYSPDKGSSRDRQYVAQVVAHEIAHQWFGDLVTMTWWHALWLNEGFATYVEYEGVDRVEPSWGIWDYFLEDNLSRALSVDEMESSQALSMQEFEVQTDDDIDRRFSSISYSKGACILRMLRHYLDSQLADSFMAGIGEYLKAHQYKNADTPELWSALHLASGVDVESMMNTWSFQAGYPVVICESQQGHLRLSQRRYLIDKTVDVGFEPFSIPISFAFGGGAEQTLVLRSSASDTGIPYTGSELLLLNKNRTGYFRVMYPSLDPFLADVESPNGPLQSDADVFGLMDDYFDFSYAASRTVNMTQLLTLCRSVATRFRQYISVNKALRTLIFLGQRVSGLDLGPMMRSLIDPVLARIGATVTPEEPHGNSILRSNLARMAVDVGATFATSTLLDAFGQIKSGRASSVHPDLHEGAYRAAMTVPTDLSVLQSNYDWLLNYYRTAATASPGDRTAALLAITFSQNPAIVSKILNAALDSNVVKPQDTAAVLSASALKNERATWEFVKAHWAVLQERYKANPRSLSNIMKQVTAGFSTAADEQDIRQFLLARAFDPDTVAEIEATIQSRASWLQRHGEATSAWFQSVNKK
jgi:aminopeptidase N